jgi:hypothetical protein
VPSSRAIAISTRSLTFLVSRAEMAATASDRVSSAFGEKAGRDAEGVRGALIAAGMIRVPCACRKCHPCRSGGVVVLVEDAAQLWVSADVEPGDLGWVGDRLWQWS